MRRYAEGRTRSDGERRRMWRAARVHRLSLNTEKTYVSWARRFILYHDKKHPKDMAERRGMGLAVCLPDGEDFAGSTFRRGT